MSSGFQVLLWWVICVISLLAHAPGYVTMTTGVGWGIWIALWCVEHGIVAVTRARLMQSPTQEPE